MIEGPTRPMEIAGKVLNLETLLLINKTMEIKSKGMAILDRWALNEPEKLKALEKESQTALIMLVMEQQAREASILETPQAEEQLRTGLVPHEILEMHGVSMSLDPTLLFLR